MQFILTNMSFLIMILDGTLTKGTNIDEYCEKAGEIQRDNNTEN